MIASLLLLLAIAHRRCGRRSPLWVGKRLGNECFCDEDNDAHGSRLARTTNDNRSLQYIAQHLAQRFRMLKCSTVRHNSALCVATLVRQPIRVNVLERCTRLGRRDVPTKAFVTRCARATAATAQPPTPTVTTSGCRVLKCCESR